MNVLYVGNWITRPNGFMSDEFRVAAAFKAEGDAVERAAYSPGFAPPRGDYDLALWSKLQGGVVPADVKAVKYMTGAPQVMWHWDAAWRRPKFEWFWRCVPEFDLVCHNEGGLLERYERETGAPWRYLDTGVDSLNRFAGRARDGWRCGVGFIGGAHAPGRVDLMRALAERFVVRIWAVDPEPWRRAGLEAHGPVYGQDLADAVASGDVWPTHSHKSWCAGSWSNRLYTVIGNGGFCLAQSAPWLDRAFWPDAHVGVWRTPEDCAEQVAVWLDNADARQNAAALATAHAYANHTWRHRVRQLKDYAHQLGLLGPAAFGAPRQDAPGGRQDAPGAGR